MDVGTDVLYRIDASNCIVSVNDAWNVFAAANDGAHLQSDYVVGKNLLEAICDPTTRDLYEALVIRVRKHERPVQFTFRCDSPDFRRLLQMQISPLPDHHVRFRVTPLSIQSRPPVALIAANLPRSAASMLICGWCKKFPASDGGWLEVEDAALHLELFHDSPLPTLTHGICPSCHALVVGMLDEPILSTSRAATPEKGDCT